ncbi:MAG TPA: gfo/Idh/MocA family oxidoreductase [Phycisphaerales bacterium]|mgnify:CR=1 FL=1|nr:gfo/Idh/MocA family oxidoreductase [Phycisphaerales bacterium]
MVRIGVLGLGTMGNTHLDAYGKIADANIVAVCDIDPDVLSGKNKTEGNIEGQAKGAFDLQSPELKKFTDGMEMINDPDIDMIDICLPTPEHIRYAVAALNAGKHTFMEKPLARTVADTQQLIDATANAKGLNMCALCMRFWPQWVWLKEQVEKQTFGKVLSATFKRVASHPGRGFYLNGGECGGAALDLHIHDTDFVKYLFGMPKSVISQGYSKETTAVDHLSTQYIYDDIPLVTAEGGWSMTDGFGFQMLYTVNFEKATAVFDIGKPEPLMLHQVDKESVAVTCEPEMGYYHEIKYFLECVKNNTMPSHATFADAAESVKIVLAEVQSVQTGLPVSLD